MKITVHRALARIKTTKERLSTLMTEVRMGSNVFLADVYSNRNKVCLKSGKAQEDTEKLIQGTWDKFNSLFNELVELKKAITLSNAGITSGTELQKVIVCGKEYTVAELIALQSVHEIKKNWHDIIKEANVKNRRTFENKCEAINDKLDQHISISLGSDAKKNDPSSVELLSKAYMEQNGFVLVDPLNLSKKIEELEKAIADYEVESDAALSEANALRTIELPD